MSWSINMKLCTRKINPSLYINFPGFECIFFLNLKSATFPSSVALWFRNLAIVVRQNERYYLFSCISQALETLLFEFPKSSHQLEVVRCESNIMFTLHWMVVHHDIVNCKTSWRLLPFNICAIITGINCATQIVNLTILDLKVSKYQVKIAKYRKYIQGPRNRVLQKLIQFSVMTNKCFAALQKLYAL